MTIARKSFAAGVTAGYAVAAGLRFPVGAAEFNWKMAHAWPSSHPIGIRTQQAAQKILEQTNGRLQIRVYPEAILAGGPQMIEQARLGAIEISGAPYDILEGIAQPCGLLAMPFLFSGHAQATQTMDASPFGQQIRALISKTGLYVFDRTWDGGFRQITNNVRPIRTPADIKGLKIRTSVSPMSVSTWRALGAAPTAIDGSQMYLACQTHVVDGTDLPLPSVDAFKMYEVQKYASVTNHQWTGYPFVANAGIWQKLPPELQTIVERNMDAAVQLERADIVKVEDAAQKTLEGHGMVVNTADAAQFKGVIHNAGLYGQWRSQYGSAVFDQLQRAVGPLA